MDILLPFELRPKPLAWLFLDLNSYFASVEQQERPELRGRPVAVVPLDADTTSVIAASQEAKLHGVKCGVMVSEAKRRCPGLVIVPARGSLYSAYHERIVEALESVLPVDAVCSIDEMKFRLLGDERIPEVATQLGTKLKEKLAQTVGSCMRCSIGIAPNAFLAKIATELQKPDGLVVLQSQDLPGRLLELSLTDFPGINKRLQARLQASGIFDTRDLWSSSKPELKLAFGSIIGERWWYLLRGFDLPTEARDGNTLSHSHVLPPEMRNDEGCRKVLMRLTEKAAARLRHKNLWTSDVLFFVRGRESWQHRVKLAPTHDTVTLTATLLEAWRSRSIKDPMLVGVVASRLKGAQEITPSLFDAAPMDERFSEAMDRVNQRFGKHSIFLAGMEEAADMGDEKIAFQKTKLFSEGAGDNVWDAEKA